MSKQEVSPIRLLIVDDSEEDVMILARQLSRKGLQFDFSHIEYLEDLQNELERQPWDIVLTDHKMVGFSSAEVIHIVKSHNADLPIIIVSGQIPEQTAVESMHLGAKDFVMKDNLARLIPVITRESEQHESRKLRQKLEQEYSFLRYHDNLTSLINRQEFENSVVQALNQAKDSHVSTMLMLLDLDQFKVVNDTCGHIAGDELLVKTTKLLQDVLNQEEILARIGGDEFGILLQNRTAEQAFSVAERIRQKMKEESFFWQNRKFEVSVSIGMVQIDQNAGDHQEILSCADVACHAAKDRGRGNIILYSTQDEEFLKRRKEMHWAPAIKQAAEENQFVLHQQAMISLQHPDTPPFYEFLLRLMQHERQVAPGEFIPAAERYNLMPVIDRWVVKNVFQYLRSRALHQTYGQYFINLSGSTLSDREFFEDIKTMQRHFEIDPEIICFEITETAAIDNLCNAVGFITEIRQRGFKFALDDFGVGLSSFSYLKMIPVDYLKIDGSFVQNLLSNKIDRGIVDACNRIAHEAGLKTVAEFVENEETLNALKEIDIDFAQGFGISKPGPLPE
ncbi:response regulator receiver-modulated signal transduction diguanylate cyclase/phosphodiesterase [Oleiphilus messinensis]|uniref:Response regulator receiver-modulated signal transduction diguanylate cyclase/phosphodiesterase n=1 Tax=Oleiphilus messinensis TaxID=141451 RepID=A0A1Y0IEN8_9GAMM|nr:GGDEF domain-containing response regulator [Oleiphilus messinensis]ARU58911.1 response regulator receiver-modulated signal transduction diguanylate cyclase/phosphodiesterase [Oleiphilus messinensis]